MNRYLMLLAGMTVLLSFAPCAAEDDVYRRHVQPVLLKKCGSCHHGTDAKSNLRIDRLDPNMISGGDADTWHDVLAQINLGDMPPDDAAALNDEERDILTTWLTSSLKSAADAKRRAGGCLSSRRLTRYEYAATMRDLLGIEYDFARELPPEPASREGFLNNGDTLEMSPTQIETYLSVARRALAIAIMEGEQPEVFRCQARQTAVGKLPKRRDGGATPVNPEFILDVRKFPRSGAFEIQVKASAIIPKGDAIPQMRVSLGCVPGIVHVPRKLVGSVDVLASPDNPQTFTFRGRMEDYPQSGDREFGNVAFKGVIVLIDFFDADGKELRYAHRTYADPVAKPNKKKAPVKVQPLPPLEEPLLDIVIESVQFTAPVFYSWPPKTTKGLLSVTDPESPEPQRAREIISRFMTRAFRRPATNDEVNRVAQFFQQVRSKGQSFHEAIRESLASILVSPHFLYSTDRGDDFSLAERLAYFLTATMPDERLYRLAESGRLSEAETLASEVERLIDDPRSNQFVRHFADQWFDLGGLDRVAVNPEFFPQFDESLKEAMREETRGVLREIVANDLSCLELIDSNWTVANRALAQHYGLAQTPRGSTFQRVTLTVEDQRGGILNHGAFLLSNSSGESSHPIKRAVWILDRLLASPPAPPPPDVPELDAESPDLQGLTLKQQLELHRKKEACNHCHKDIDPWGIALENYDAIGLFRTRAPARVGGKRKVKKLKLAPKLDPSTTLPDGEKLTGAEDLKRYIQEHRREQFARAVVERVVTYALGRSLDFGDREAIDALTTTFLADGLRLRGLIANIVASDLFRNPSR